MQKLLDQVEVPTEQERKLWEKTQTVLLQLAFDKQNKAILDLVVTHEKIDAYRGCWVAIESKCYPAINAFTEKRVSIDNALLALAASKDPHLFAQLYSRQKGEHSS